METMTIQELKEATGLNQYTLYRKYINTGVIERVSKGKFNKEQAEKVIHEVQEHNSTVAPSRTGVAKDKMELLEDWGIIHKEANGRYSKESVDLAKHLKVHVKGDKTYLTKTVPRVMHKDTVMTLTEMQKASGMSASTLLHYVRSGRIQKLKDGYSEKSFKAFMTAQEHLLATSKTKKEVMEELGISKEECDKLVKEHHLEKASFDRYTQKSIDALKGMAKGDWSLAPTYEPTHVQKSFTHRDLPEDQILTLQEVAQRIGRQKSTIGHLVQEGKIELVGRNAYSLESVENYMKSVEGDNYKPCTKADIESQEVSEEPSEVEYYTANEVKDLLGIDHKTSLTYYIKKNLIQKDGNNKYTKASVDRYLEAKSARSEQKKQKQQKQQKVSKPKVVKPKSHVKIVEMDEPLSA